MVDDVAKFDGLAEDYDRSRPRYPRELFSKAMTLIPPSITLSILDAGAGTGIALEGLLPLLPVNSLVRAADISTDMVGIGRRKFPDVVWSVGSAEQLLEGSHDVDLVVAAQAYQWMDRPRFVQAARRAVRPGGVCMIVQNNRHFQAGGFVAAYEDMLEEYSPGYERSYRAIDIASELGAAFEQVERLSVSWEQHLSVEEFVTMCSSSTQAQRAVASHGPVFLHRVRDLAAIYAARGGSVTVPYIAEGYYGSAGA